MTRMVGIERVWGAHRTQKLVVNHGQPPSEGCQIAALLTSRRNSSLRQTFVRRSPTQQPNPNRWPIVTCNLPWHSRLFRLPDIPCAHEEQHLEFLRAWC